MHNCQAMRVRDFWEPLFVAFLFPIAMFPTMPFVTGLVIIPVLWLMRWRRGALPARIRLDLPIVLLVCCLPLAAINLGRWAAIEKPVQTTGPAGMVPDNQIQLTPGAPVSGAASLRQDATEGSLAMWVRPTDWSGNDGSAQMLIHQAGTKNNVIYKWHDNRLYFWEPGIGDVVSGPVDAHNLGPNAWHLIVVDWNQSATIDGVHYALLYVDGAVIGSRTIPFVTEPWGELLIGEPDEELGDVANWRRPLTPPEIQQAFASGNLHIAALGRPDLLFYAPSPMSESNRVVLSPGTSGTSSLLRRSINVGIGLLPWCPGACAALNGLTAGSLQRDERTPFHVAPTQPANRTLTGLQVGAWYAAIIGYTPTVGRCALTVTIGPGQASMVLPVLDDTKTVTASLPFQANATTANIVWRTASGCSPASFVVAYQSVSRLTVVPASYLVALQDSHDGIGNYRKLLGLLLGIALAYAIVDLAATERHLVLMVRAVVFAGAAVAALSIPFTRWDVRDKLLPFSSRLVLGHAQAQLFSVNPNEVAGVIAFLLPLAIAACLDSQRLWRFLLSAAAAELFVVLLLDQSRTAIVAAVIATALLGSWRARRLSAPLVIAGIASSLAILYWLRRDPLLGGRLEIWGVALRIIPHFFWTGVGIGQFDVVYAAYNPAAGSGDYIPHAHNLILQAALDLGIFGAAAYLGVLACGLMLAWQGAARPTRSWLASGLGCSLVGFLLFGISDTIAPGARGGVFLWAVLGLIAAREQLRRRTAIQVLAEGVPAERCAGPPDQASCRPRPE